VANPPHNAPSRWLAHWTLPCALMLAALAVGTTPKLVGDGGEYFVYAVAMARGSVPPLTQRALADGKSELASADARFQAWDTDAATIAGPPGDRDFVHFWFYPALAAPGVAVARLGA